MRVYWISPDLLEPPKYSKWDTVIADAQCQGPQLYEAEALYALRNPTSTHYRCCSTVHRPKLRLEELSTP